MTGVEGSGDARGEESGDSRGGLMVSTPPHNPPHSGNHCLTFDRSWTCSLHNRHFLTREAQMRQVTTCPHGPNTVSRLLSEHTIHSVRFASWS